MSTYVLFVIESLRIWYCVVCVLCSADGNHLINSVVPGSERAAATEASTAACSVSRRRRRRQLADEDRDCT